MIKKLKFIDPLTGKTPTEEREAHSSIQTGIRGVYLFRQTSEWDVVVTIDSQRIYLGRFPTLQEALQARDVVEAPPKKVQPEPPIKSKTPVPKRPLADFIGKKYGRLTVIDEGKKHLGQRTCRCRCECGNYKDVNPSSLKRGSTKSCGCLHKEISRNRRVIKDLSGQTFGRLTALREVEPQGSQRYWLCQCSCGREKEVLGSSLKNGNTRSCGCLRMEMYNKND